MNTFYSRLLSILTIVGVGIIVYSNSFLCSFHFDDDAYIVHNFAIRNIQNLADIWNICPCRFVTFLSIALNYHFQTLNLFGYHLFNLVIHIGTALLVYWLILLTFSTPKMKEDGVVRHANIIALLAALIFVTHPLQTEAVTYIWQRAASMTAFFYLASLCFYIKSRLLDSSPQSEPTIGPGIIYYLLSLIAAVAAMFTKENAITLPLMILLYEVCFIKTRRELDWLQLFPFLLSTFIIPKTMLLTLSARFQELRSITGGPSGITPLDYLMTQFRVMITYLRLLILPIHLNLDYDYPVHRTLFAFPVIASLLTLTAILYLTKRLFKEYRLLSFSILWFFLTLLPESSILPQTDVIFEHRLYLPMVGYCIFLVSGLYYLTTIIRHSKRRSYLPTLTVVREESQHIFKILIALLSIIIIFNSILTYQRNKIWTNEITLWSDIVQKSPHKARPYINRGWAFYNEGDINQALSDYNKAIDIDPTLIYPYDDRGLIYAQQGKLAQAITEYDKAIKLNPYFPKVYDDRALGYIKQNNYSQALKDLNKAIKLNPEYIDAYNSRADLYLTQNNLFQAIANLKESLRIDPNQTDVRAKLKNITTLSSNTITSSS